jgi:hypothetical protein
MNPYKTHAPGGWTFRMESTNRYSVRAFQGNYLVASDVAGEGNARLIASAPELAAALLALVDTANAHCPVDHPALPVARNILRKAALIS